jgi:flagellar FliJ protein
MSWAESLIRIATFEVETRQKRLADIVERRMRLETQLAVLHAEGEAEAKHAGMNAESGWYHVGYADGLRIRKAAIEAEIDAVAAEERGARDALSLAYEEQKKYEHVAEAAHTMQVKEAARRETASLDELGLRRSGR